MLILYERMFFLSNIMFIFFVCFICFFISHPLHSFLWQKWTVPKQNGIPIPFWSGLSRTFCCMDSSCPSDYPSFYSITTFLPLCSIMMHLQFFRKMLQSFLSWWDIKSVSVPPPFSIKRRAVRLVQTLSPIHHEHYIVLVLNSLLPLKAVYLYLH